MNEDAMPLKDTHTHTHTLTKISSKQTLGSSLENISICSNEGLRPACCQGVDKVGQLDTAFQHTQGTAASMQALPLVPVVLLHC